MDRELPHSTTSEKGLVGQLIDDPLKVCMLEDLTPSDFYDETFRVLFESFMELYKNDTFMNETNVIQKLASMDRVKELGIDEISLVDISSDREVLFNDFNYLRKYLIDLSARRHSIMLLYKYMSKMEDTTQSYSHLRNSLTNDLNRLRDTSDDCMTIHDGICKLQTIIDNNDKDIFTGVKTGFEKIDEFGGLQAGHLMIIGASTSSGKTALAMNIVHNVAKGNTPVAVYSMEMKSHELAARLISTESGVSSSRMLYNKMSQYDKNSVRNAIGSIDKLPIYVNESCRNVSRIERDIRVKKRRYGIRVAVVDYLQMMPRTVTRNESDARALGEIARHFKDLAEELDICVILLSQFNRDNDTDEPDLKNIRGSGEICEAADEVLLIWRPELKGQHYKGDFADVHTHNTAMFKLDKGRSTGIGKWIQGFAPEVTKFYDLEEVPRGESLDQPREKRDVDPF